MAKLIGPDFIALQVRDLEASKRFYIERLGLSLADRSPPGCEFRFNPATDSDLKPAVLPI